MPKKPAPPDRPRARTGRGGAAPGVLIDDLAAERNSPPLPPEPVFTIDLVEAEGGKRGRRYVAELEEHASRNARAAAEARRIALEQRGHLEEAARGRRKAEREISKLQRELRTAVADQQRLTAQLAKTQRAPKRAAPPDDPPRGAAAKSELTRTREMMEQQTRLLGERREQVVRALRERDEARIEARRASEACVRTERKLSRATEMLQQHALDESAKISATNQDTRDAADEYRAARSVLDVEMHQLNDEVEHLTTQAVELEDALSRQQSRADDAERRAAALVADVEAMTVDAAAARRELADALTRDANTQAAISELTERLGDVEAAAATAAADRDAASARVVEVEQQLDASWDERDSAAAHARQLETALSETAAECEAARSQLAATVEARESALVQLADVERLAAAHETDGTAAVRRVAELTEQLAELEAAAASTRSDQESASARADEMERQLTDAMNDRKLAADQVRQMEALVSDTAAEREAARAQLAELEHLVHAREEGETSAARQVSELTERLAQLEISAATATSEHDQALAHIAELEATLAASADHEPDDEATAYVGELETRLARAEQDATAAATRVAELTRDAADARSERSAIEEARAADHRHAEAQLARLGDRIAELEQMIPAPAPPPDPSSTRSLALEQLGQLAAQEPVREPAPTPANRGARVARHSSPPANDGEAAEPGELRRSLLADLSDLAHEPAPQRAEVRPRNEPQGS